MGVGEHPLRRATCGRGSQEPVGRRVAAIQHYLVASRGREDGKPPGRCQGSDRQLRRSGERSDHAQSAGRSQTAVSGSSPVGGALVVGDQQLDVVPGDSAAPVDLRDCLLGAEPDVGSKR